MSKSAAQRFSVLIEPHLDALFRAAYRLARQQADAEDLVQETCVRAYLKLDQLRESRPARAWLLRIMHNLFVDGLRRARLAPMQELSEAAEASAAEPGTDPEASLGACERETEIERAWQRLDRGHRALLALRAEGYTVAEIGEITGLAADVLNARLYRARRSFARHLERERDPTPVIDTEIAR